MRAALVLVIALAPACKIADTHFIGLTGDDDARSDGAGDGQGIDGMPGNASKVYISDQTGIHRLSRNLATGALTYVGVAANTPSASLAIDSTGTHLYAADQTLAVVHDFVISPTGTLSPPTDAGVQGCSPKELARHPQNGFLAVGCGSNTSRVMTAPIGANGDLGSFAMHVNGASPAHIAFSPGGHCLFAGDENAGILQGLVSYTTNLADITSLVGSYPTNSTPHAAAAFQGLVMVAVPGMLRGYTYTESQCQPGLGGQQYTSSALPNRILIDPTNLYVLVLGTEVYVYKIVNMTLTPMATPYLGGQGTITSGAFDPAMPTVVYLTRQNGDIQIATLDATGALTLTTTINTTINNPTWIQLVP